MNGSAIFHAATQCLHCTFYEWVFWSRVRTWHKKVNNLILVKVLICADADDHGVERGWCCSSGVCG